MIRTPALVATCALAVAATSAELALAHQSLPKGRYDCVVFYAPGVPSPTGRAVKIKGPGKYAFFNSKRWKAGTYKHKAGGGLKFKTGPLKGKAGEHKVYGNGKHGVDVVFKTAQGSSRYYCS